MKATHRTLRIQLAVVLLAILGAVTTISSISRAEPGDLHFRWGPGLGVAYAKPSTHGKSYALGYNQYEAVSWELNPRLRLGGSFGFLMGGASQPATELEKAQSAFSLSFFLGPTLEAHLGSVILATTLGYRWLPGRSYESGPQLRLELGARETFDLVKGSKRFRHEQSSSLWMGYGPLISGGWSAMAGVTVFLGK